MNLDFDIEEITSILGIKNKFSELENIIRKKENLSFLSAIELILENPESNKLIPKSNTIQPNQSEMFINFTETLGITDIQQVELKDEIKESKFEEGIKTKNNIYKNINLYFSEDYKNKIKNDFILPKEEEFETIDAGKFQIEVVNQNKKEKRPKKSKNKGNNNNNNNINVNVEDNIDISMNTSQNDSQQNQNINKTKKNSKKSKNSSNNNIPKPQNKNSQKYNIDEIEGEPLEQFQQSQHQNISMKKQKHKKNMQTSPQPIVDNYTNNNMNNPIEKKKKPKKKKANKSNMSNSGNNIDSNNDNQ